MAQRDTTNMSRAAPAAPHQSPRLGASIRSLRKLKGLKLRDLAAHVGCSESLLSKIETGATTPSLHVLGGIAACLQVNVGLLFSPDELPSLVSRAGARAVVPLHGPGSSVERLVPPSGGHLLEANLHTLAPRAGSRRILSHVGEEVGYVLEGSFELRVGQAVLRLGPGDSFNFRSEDPHSFRNPGRTTTRVMWVSTPSRSASAPPKAASRRRASR
jgi:transcriptional regulator with XRE-family HTH domain/mannose-6-phosphate isomerase-like protein (cupin superfamily)